MHVDDRSRSLTRRQALAAGLAATGWALGGRLRGADEPTDSGPYGPFKMGIQSYSLRSFKLHEAMNKTRDLGLHYWEVYPAHIPSDAGGAAHQREHAEEHGVQVVGYGVVPFTKDHDANRRLFEFGKAMGIAYFSADPAPESFDSLDKLVEEFGIPVGIHNHGPGHRYAAIDAISAAIKDHHEKIGCCIDTGHFLRSREDPVRAAEVFGKRIYGVHLKDVKDAKTFTVLGEGDLRTAELLRVLAKLKYNYCLALEYEEKPEDPIEDIKACLAATRKAVGQL
jgi:sugar phosphate isomerase/epimerase